MPGRGGFSSVSDPNPRGAGRGSRGGGGGGQFFPSLGGSLNVHKSLGVKLPFTIDQQ